MIRQRHAADGAAAAAASPNIATTCAVNIKIRNIEIPANVLNAS
ncbi:hypothetical protein LT85_4096 [Collimonas arenae]|uniref:Uncharacterized protein n=1 Tax=Collimonas arenae TaxID=279058 RepID=A0A0A1FI15_9BURK|nr:hypothetical protein LT85_4096 [Collimonas arenae]